jgi:ribosomal protein S18 acetylase RimI-like enzyme
MIRNATKEDAAQAIPLIHKACGSIANTLVGADDDEEIVNILMEFFQQEGNRLSYQNTIIAERDHHVVGVLVSYHGSRCEGLDQPFLDRQYALFGRVIRNIAKEAQPDEFYLDSLAVAEEFRRQGIAAMLIAAFEESVRAQGYDKVALLAEESNKPAFRLYRKLGYVTDGIVCIHGDDYHHMAKLLSRTTA